MLGARRLHHVFVGFGKRFHFTMPLAVYECCIPRGLFFWRALVFEFVFLFFYCVLPIDPNMNWDIDSYKYKCKVLTVVSKSCGTTSQVECFKLCIC